MLANYQLQEKNQLLGGGLADRWQLCLHVVTKQQNK